jgi:YD repeat-containing protein
VIIELSPWRVDDASARHKRVGALSGLRAGSLADLHGPLSSFSVRKGESLMNRCFVPVRRALVALALMLGLGAGPAQAVGEFTHSYPIRIPDGVQGMQPNLALVYNSDAGNDIAGVGWGLSGLPTITRVSYGNGVNYDAKDSFLHSTLGLLVPQTDGTYRTKVESFRKFVPQGTCGSGPCSWLVYEPSGVQEVYGGTTYSRLLNTGTSVRAWAISSRTDLFGNYYTVSYVNSTGHFLPLTVTYAMSTATPHPTKFRTVEFTYSSRGDVETSYAQAAQDQLASRLQWIAVKSGDALIRKYRLDYECGFSSDPCSGSLTNRSRLTAITEYDSLGTHALPPEKFTWQTGSHWSPPDPLLSDWEGLNLAPPSGDVSSRYSSTSSTYSDGVMMADLDGDGRLDLIQGFLDDSSGTSVIQSGAWLTSGYYPDWTWATSNAFALPQGVYFTTRHKDSLTGIDMGLRLVDLNGDGLPDLIQGFWPNYPTTTTLVLRAWLNNGGHCSGRSCAWVPAPQYAPPQAFRGTDTHTPSGFDLGAQIIDIDGDGRPDILWGFDWELAWGSGVLNSMRMAYINSGSGWTNTPTFAPPFSFIRRDSKAPAGFDEGVRFADLNGDGKPDILQSSSDYGTVTRGAWVNSGSGWVANSSYLTPTGIYFSQRDSSAPGGWDSGLRVQDLNADNRSDLILGFSNSGTLTSSAWINSGAGWVSNTALAPPVAIAGRSSALPGGWDGGVRFVDLNGDGRPDMLLGLNNTGISTRQAYLCSGQGWSAYAALAPPVDFSEVWVDSALHAWWDKGALLGDVLGTGRLAILWGDSGTSGARALPRFGTDLMVGITSGLGGTTAITYRSAQYYGMNQALGYPGVADRRARNLAVLVEQADGRGQVYSSKLYQYGAMRWVPGAVPDQRDLGFDSIYVSDSKSGESVETVFNQSPGLEKTVKTVSTEGSTVSYVYKMVSPSPGTELVLEQSRTETQYENGIPVSTRTRTASDFDPYGNAQTVVEQATGLPDVTTVTTYLNDEVSWVLGRVQDVTVSSGGIKLSETFNVWTGNVLSAIRRWIDTDGSWAETLFGHDSSGNLTKVTEPASADGLLRNTTIVYDGTFNAYPAQVTDALGMSVTRTFNDAGQVLTIKDPNQQTTKTNYDYFWRPITIIRPDGGSTAIFYQSLGDPNSQNRLVNTYAKNQSPNGPWGYVPPDLYASSVAEYYDGTGFVYAVKDQTSTPTVVIDRVKDVAGRLGQVSDPHFDGVAAGGFTVYGYDPRGRLKTRTAPDSGLWSYDYGTDVLLGVTYLTVSITDPNRQVVRRYIDARGETRRVVDAARQNTDYEHDPLQRLTRVDLPDGSYQATTFDSLGRRTTTTDSQLGQTVFGYDADSHLLSVTAGGKSVGYTYDKLNRLIS